MPKVSPLVKEMGVELEKWGAQVNKVMAQLALRREWEVDAVCHQEDVVAAKCKAEAGKERECGLSKDVPMVVVSEDEELPLVSELVFFFFFFLTGKALLTLCFCSVRGACHCTHAGWLGARRVASQGTSSVPTSAARSV
jgi:hypothetical protein